MITVNGILNVLLPILVYEFGGYLQKNEDISAITKEVRQIVNGNNKTNS